MNTEIILPTNEQIEAMLKPAMNALSGTQSYQSLVVELKQGYGGAVKLELRVWDSLNESFHYGVSFDDVAKAKAESNPITCAEKAVAFAESELEAARATLAAAKQLEAAEVHADEIIDARRDAKLQAV